VNLSARQFVQAELLATVQLALDDSGLPSRLLELEITEGSLMSDPAGATAIMQGLRMMGVKLALDDFGTGYSSLAYLKNFPLDRLKLDRAFVTELVSEPHDQAIAQAVISLGHVLDMDVLAEGVETAEQSEMLGRFGCDVFQGYLFGKPMSAAALEAEIAAGRLVPRPPGVAR
jgi:EAL domain-containing protein (putative c-di-GMP-specific phosphodiesterase class I)